MAKVRRFSGNLKLELSFNDRKNEYRVRICPVRGREKACETVFVGPPRHLTRAVDSAAAYDETARAAISFARPKIQEQAAIDRAMTTWAISRGRRRLAKKHPKRVRS